MKHNTHYKEAQKHILDAPQTGYGSNSFPISPVISYLKGGHGNRNWLRNTWGCRYNYSSGNKKVNHGNTIRECDDYPFHASYEGGAANYDSLKVSLRPISRYDNQGSGTMWNKMTRRGGRMPNGTNVIIAPKGLKSFYIRNGRIGF